MKQRRCHNMDCRAGRLHVKQVHVCSEGVDQDIRTQSVDIHTVLGAAWEKNVNVQLSFFPCPTPALMLFLSSYSHLDGLSKRLDSKSWYLLPSSGHLAELHAGLSIKSISKSLSLKRLFRLFLDDEIPAWRLHGKRHTGQPLSITIFPSLLLISCQIPFKEFCVSILLVNSSKWQQVIHYFFFRSTFKKVCTLCTQS